MKKVILLAVTFALLLSCISFPVFASDDSSEEQRTFFQKVGDLLTDIKTGIGGIVGGIGDKLESVFTNLRLKFVEFHESLSSLSRICSSWFQAISDQLSLKLREISDWFGQVNSTISTKVGSVVSWLKDIHSTLSSKLSSSVSWLSNLNDTLSDGFNTLFKRIDEGLFNGGLSATVDAINDLPDKLFSGIPDSIKDIFMVPDSSEVDPNPFNDFSEAFNNGFSFIGDNIDQITGFVQSSLEKLVPYTGGFVLLAHIFEPIAAIPFFDFLLHLSLALGLLGLSLHLISSIVSAGRKAGHA